MTESDIRLMKDVISARNVLTEMGMKDIPDWLKPSTGK